MSRNRNRGGRRLQVAFASAIAACAVGAVGVSSASAATITLDHGFLKISGLEDPTEIINADTGPVQLNNVTYSGGTSGTFTTTPANVDFPTFEGEASGVPLIVDVNPLEDLNGNLPAEGQLAFTETDFEAIIELGPPINSTCRIAPIPLSLVTADNSVFRGDVFDAGTSNPPMNGAITDDWASLPAADARRGRRLRPDPGPDERTRRPLAVERHRDADAGHGDDAAARRRRRPRRRRRSARRRRRARRRALRLQRSARRRRRRRSKRFF